MRHRGAPLRIQSPVARVWMVAALMFGLASKSKSPSHLSRGKFAALILRMEGAQLLRGRFAGMISRRGRHVLVLAARSRSALTALCVLAHVCMVPP